MNFSDKPWDGRKSLIDIMKVPNEFKSYVENYNVKVFAIAFLEDDIIENLQVILDWWQIFLKINDWGERTHLVMIKLSTYRN